VTNRVVAPIRKPNEAPQHSLNDHAVLHGTITDRTTSAPVPTDHQPNPKEKMGVVWNLTERTVSFQGFVVPISSVDAASINFNGEQIGPVAQIANKEGYTNRIDGILDSLAGHMAADTMTSGTKRLSDPSSSIVKDHTTTCCARRPTAYSEKDDSANVLRTPRLCRVRCDPLDHRSY